MITWTRVAQPTVEPVMLDDVMAWASVGIDDMVGAVDAQVRELIRELVPEQREAIERYTDCVLVVGSFVIVYDREDIVHSGTRRMHPLLSAGQLAVLLPGFYGQIQGFLEIPIRPLVTVTRVTATDIDGTDTVIPSTDYFVIAGEYGKIVLRPGCTWGVTLRTEACIKVECTAGYATPVVPVQQTSTDTVAVITGSEVDATLGLPVRYGFETVTGNPVSFAVYGSTLANYSDEVAVRALAGVSVGNTSHLTLPVPTKDYYRVKIQSTALGKAGEAVVSGLSGAIPGPLVLAVRELVRYYFMHRGDGLFVGVGGFKGVAPTPDVIFNKIDSYRWPVVA